MHPHSHRIRMSPSLTNRTGNRKSSTFLKFRSVHNDLQEKYPSFVKYTPFLSIGMANIYQI